MNATQIKLAILAVVFAAWTFGAYTTGVRLERAKWEREQSAEKDVVIDYKDRSDRLSQSSGQAYETTRAAIQKKLTTPDKGLQDELQGPAGDIELPASLGLRLNAIAEAGKAKQTAGELDSTVSGDHPVPDQEVEAP